MAFTRASVSPPPQCPRPPRGTPHTRPGLALRGCVALGAPAGGEGGPPERAGEAALPGRRGKDDGHGLRVLSAGRRAQLTLCASQDKAKCGDLETLFRSRMYWVYRLGKLRSAVKGPFFLIRHAVLWPACPPHGPAVHRHPSGLERGWTHGCPDGRLVSPLRALGPGPTAPPPTLCPRPWPLSPSRGPHRLRSFRPAWQLDRPPGLGD